MKIRLIKNLLAVVLVLTVFFGFSRDAYAASISLTGKAKVANTGAYLDFTGYSSNVVIDSITGNFSGYGYLEDLGWVAFGTADNDLGPVNINISTGVVTGKAKVISTGAYLDFTNYSSNVAATMPAGVFSGNVFSEDIGWLNFADTGVSTNGSFDNIAPSGGSISYIDGYQTTASVVLSVSDGADAGSGLNTSSRIIERKSTALSAGNCDGFGSFSTITPTGIYPTFIDSTVSTNNCYQYQYKISDNAGNQVIYASSNVVKVDSNAPSNPGIPSTTTPTNSTSQTWTFNAATDAVTGVANYLWRTTGTAISNGTSTENSVVTSLAEGFYNFFVKSVDNAGNESVESTSSLIVDITAPVTSDNVSASWSNATVNITLSCSDTSGSGCATTYYTTDGATPTTSSTAGTLISLSSSGTYTIKYFSIDAAGNTESVKTAVNTVKIETASPSTGSISYTDGYYTTTSIPLTVSDGIDVDSGLNISSRITERKSATLSAGTCGSFNSFSTITPTGTYPNLIDSTVSTNTCYQYQYKISDNAGNQVTYINSNLVKVDIGAPTDPGTPSTTTPTKSTSQTWTFTAATDAVSGVANYLWRTTGTAITNGISAANSVVTSLTDGIYNFFVKSVDNAGNESAESTSSVTVDTNAPIATLTSINIASTSATINWTTNESSSTQLEYGPANSYGTTTTKTDVSSRTTMHVNALSSLSSCSTYHYRFLTEDGLLNTAADSYRTFTTSGCTNNAVVISENYAQATVASGGTLDLIKSDNTGLTLTIPSDYSTENAAFQAHQLDIETVVAETDLPTGFTSVGSYMYELKALINNDSIISVFEAPLTITIAYNSSDIVTLEESSLKIWSWDGSSWTELTDCVVDKTAKTVTCATSHFSLFGLFGQVKTTSSSGGSSSSSSSSSSSNQSDSTTCTNNKPSSNPDLFQINVNSNTAKLFFTPISSTNTFYVSFSTNPNAEEHGSLATLAREGVQNYTINLLKPNTTYYFKVRGQNGCMPGDWSQIIRVKTLTKNSSKQAIYYKNTANSVMTKVKQIFNFSAIKSLVPGNLEKATSSNSVPVVPVSTSTPAPSNKVSISVTEPVTATAKNQTCFLWWCW